MNDSSTQLILVKEADEVNVVAEEIINVFNNNTQTKYEIKKFSAQEKNKHKFHLVVKFVPNVITAKEFIEKNDKNSLSNKIDPKSLIKYAIISLLIDNTDMHRENLLVKNIDGQNQLILIDPVIDVDTFKFSREDFLNAIKMKDFTKAKNVLVNGNVKDRKSTDKNAKNPKFVELIRLNHIISANVDPNIKNLTLNLANKLTEQEFTEIIEELTDKDHINKIKEIILNGRTYSQSKELMNKMTENIEKNFSDLRQTALDANIIKEDSKYIAKLTEKEIRDFLKKNNFINNVEMLHTEEKNPNCFRNENLALQCDLSNKEITNTTGINSLMTLKTQDDLDNLQSLIDERTKRFEMRKKIFELLNKYTEDKDPNNKDPRKNEEKYFTKDNPKYDIFDSYFGFTVKLLDVNDNSFSIEYSENPSGNKTYAYNDDNFKALNKIIEENKPIYKKKLQGKDLTSQHLRSENVRLVKRFFEDADRGFKIIFDKEGPVTKIYCKNGFDKQYYIDLKSKNLMEEYNGKTKKILNIENSTTQFIQDALIEIDSELKNNNASKKESKELNKDDDKNTINAAETINAAKTIESVNTNNTQDNTNTAEAIESVNTNNTKTKNNKSNFSTNKIVCLALAALTLIASIVLLFTVGAIAASIAGGVGLILTGAFVAEECFSRNDVLPSK